MAGQNPQQVPYKIKWRNIPQFTSNGHYKGDYGLFKPFIDGIKYYIDECGLILCPDFQRGHVWTLQQQISYIEYLVQGGASGRDIYLNCPGWMADFRGPMVCVDGLQRITAIQRFYNNEIPIFGSYYIRDFDKINNYMDTHTMVIHVNDLETRAEVLKWYLEMNSGGTPHTAAELQRVRQLYEFELKSKH